MGRGKGRKEGEKIMKRIIVVALITCLVGGLFISKVYAGRKDQTDWHVLKKHWDKSVTKDDDLCLEYMTRVGEYVYTVPHERSMGKVAVLPPPITNRFTLKSVSIFEKDVLLNTKEMEEEYLMKPKKWLVTKKHRDTYRILQENELYDEYESFIEAFVSYRIINKKLFSKMAEVLDVDAFLFLIIGYDRPGAISALIESQPWREDRFLILNVYLFDAKEGKIVWELGYELKDAQDYLATRWRGLYKGIYKIMPIE